VVLEWIIGLAHMDYGYLAKAFLFLLVWLSRFLGSPFNTGKSIRIPMLTLVKILVE